MKKASLLAAIILTFNTVSLGQKDILYNFETPVTDTIKSGIKWYAEMYKGQNVKLKICALLMEKDNEFTIFLQDYTILPKGGYRDLIQTSNRKIKIDANTTIPIIIPADILSLQIQKEHIGS